MTDIRYYKLDSAFAQLKQFDCCAKPEDFIEVILWHNQEGFDVHLSNNESQFIRLNWGEFKAIKKLVKELDK
jgi:hypothetical protein